jgi:4-diphosphocytidyl-2-C-methyl-D-erythritol kinase
LSALRLLAPAKINLSLHVLGRRPDGYHRLESLVAFADIGDEIAVAPADTLALEVDGPFAGALGRPSDNLVMRAATLLARSGGAPSGARITLTKTLPVASGIGGGSSDAATTLLALGRLWRRPIDIAAPRLAAELGADVPVCLRRRPTVMGGIGEDLCDAPALPPCQVVLANPGVPLSTAEVFRGFGGPFGAAPPLPPSFADLDALVRYLANADNVLTSAATTLVPPVGEVLNALRGNPGCRLARLSGSGPTCFGLFASDADRVAEHLRANRPGWWVAHGELKPVPAEPT